MEEITARNLISLAVAGKTGITVVIPYGKKISKYVYQPDNGVFVHTLDHVDNHVCPLWGFPAKCSKCRSDCPRQRVLSVEHVRALSEYWQVLDVDTARSIVIVEVHSERLEQVPGVARVHL